MWVRRRGRRRLESPGQLRSRGSLCASLSRLRRLRSSACVTVLAEAGRPFQSHPWFVDQSRAGMKGAGRSPKAGDVSTAGASEASTEEHSEPPESSGAFTLFVAVAVVRLSAQCRSADPTLSRGRDRQERVSY